jgi:hypothetical protein
MSTADGGVVKSRVSEYERVPDSYRARKYRSPTTLYCWVTTLALVSFFLAVFRSIATTQTSIYVDGVDLKVSDIPRYTRADADIDVNTAASLGFHFWLFASDAFDLAVPIVALLLLAWKASIGNSFCILAVPIFMVQLAKAIYFTLYFFSAFAGVRCNQHAMCIQRDASQAADKPSFAFLIQTFFSYAFLVLTLLSFALPSIYKRVTTAKTSAQIEYSSFKAPAAKAALPLVSRKPQRLFPSEA